MEAVFLTYVFSPREGRHHLKRRSFRPSLGLSTHFLGCGEGITDAHFVGGRAKEVGGVSTRNGHSRGGRKLRRCEFAYTRTRMVPASPCICIPLANLPWICYTGHNNLPRKRDDVMAWGTFTPQHIATLLLSVAVIAGLHFLLRICSPKAQRGILCSSCSGGSSPIPIGICTPRFP